MIVEQSNPKPLSMTAMDKQPLVEDPPAYSDEFRDRLVLRDAPLPPIPPPEHEELPNHFNHSPLHSAHHHHGPAPSVDQVHICERKHPIKGTFYIDPLVVAIDRQKTKRKQKEKKALPHASFRSRHGAIDLELATTGSIEGASKADVSVSSRDGEITLKLLPMPPSRPRLGLDVESRSGKVTLYLPEGFAGVVHLTTKKGKLLVMPVLAGCVKMVKNSSQEIIFMMGSQSNVYELDVTKESSFCAIRTRSGDMNVGLSGRDQLAEEVGFWKRLGGFLSTHKSKSILDLHEAAKGEAATVS
ncbi:hypothetical protein CPC08DRAFT_439611 [Agrocybe pediades]|nr:hypothetical protein CPC08DRAFT_439611 [Agrocybe pediades]